MMDVSHHCRCQVWTESKCCAILACGWCVDQTLFLTRGQAKPDSSPRHDATSSAAGSQHETANALGLKATSRLMTLMKKHLYASCTPNVIMHYTFSFDLKTTLKFMMQLKTLLAQRIHSESCSGGLRQSFKNRHHVVTFLDVSRFFA